MRRARVVWIVLLLAAIGAACGGGGDTSSEDRPLGLESDEEALVTPETTIPTVPPTPTPTSTPEAFIYVVQGGDTLGSIASEFGTTWQEIATVNELENPNLLSLGQQIEIPQDVAVEYNSDGTVRPGERAHVVQAGETLLGIALQYNKTLDELLVANNIAAANLLQIGQQLIIPAGEEAPAP